MTTTHPTPAPGSLPAHDASPDAVRPAPSSIAPSRADAVPRRATSGVDHKTAPYDALLLASFGGPEGQDEVIPFLRHVTGGRGIPEERLEEVAVHYRTMGGVSPINAQNRALKAALEAEVARRGLDLPVLWGNRNSEPFVADVVADAAKAGTRRFLALSTSAYSSYSGCRQYREDYGNALAALRESDPALAAGVSIDRVRAYFNQEGFLAPVADGVLAGIRGMLEAGHPAAAIELVFTTHSIPDTMADASGPAETRTADSGGWYLAQHRAAVRWVVARVAKELGAIGLPMPQHSFAFQSRSGSPRTPWLEPDINDHLAELAAAGRRAIVCCPIGFVSDHMEVVWDLDTEAAETARELQLDYVRTPTAGTDPRFVSALIDLVEERVGRRGAVPTVTDFPATSDVCGLECCAVRLGEYSQGPTTGAVDASEAHL